MKVHIKDVVVPVSDVEKLEGTLAEVLPGRIIAVCQNPTFTDNWRIVWEEDDNSVPADML